MKDYVVTSDMFGKEFEEECNNQVVGKRSYSQDKVKFYEEWDQTSIKRVIKRELLKGRFVVFIAAVSVIASSVNKIAWDVYKRRIRGKSLLKEKNKQLIDNPLDAVAEELAVNESVSKREISDILRKYACFSAENIFLVAEMLKSQSVDVSSE